MSLRLQVLSNKVEPIFFIRTAEDLVDELEFVKRNMASKKLIILTPILPFLDSVFFDLLNSTNKEIYQLDGLVE